MGSAVMVSRGASYLTIQTVVTTVGQVLAFAILARIITPSEMGILAILSLITSLSQAINGAAFQQASMKYVGEYAGTQNDLAAGVFLQTLQVSLIISVPIAAFIFLGSRLLAQMLLGSASQSELFMVLAVDVLAFAGPLPAAMGAVLGAKRFKAAAIIGTAGALLRYSAIILLVLFMRDFLGLVYGWVLSDFALLIVYGGYSVRVLGLPKRLFPLKRLLSFTWPLSIGNVVSFAYGWFDRAVLIAFVPLASLGIYSAALTAFGVLNSLSGAFSNALLPVFSNISGRGVPESCRRATCVSSRYVSLVMIPLGFGLLATAKPALTLFVGQAYVGGAVPLMIFSVAFGLTAYGLVLAPMLTALGKTRAIMWITVASVVVGLGSAYGLLPFMGIVGASVARGLATVATLILTIYALKRVGVLSVDVEMAWKTIVASAVMAAVLLGVQTVNYSILLLPVYIVLGAIVYLILLRMLHAVKKHDIELVERYLGRRFRFVGGLLGRILISQAARPKTA